MNYGDAKKAALLEEDDLMTRQHKVSAKRLGRYQNNWNPSAIECVRLIRKHIQQLKRNEAVWDEVTRQWNELAPRAGIQNFPSTENNEDTAQQGVQIPAAEEEVFHLSDLDDCDDLF